MLSERIKEQRNKHKFSQVELAKLIGVAQQTVGSWEVGHTDPDPDMIAKLASFFNVTTDYLIGKDEISPEHSKQPKPKDLLKILEQEDYTLNGRIATQEDKDRLAAVIEAMYWDAKEKNKKAYAEARARKDNNK